MERSFNRDYSLISVLLDDQKDSLQLCSPSDVVDLVCKNGRTIRVHKVLLSAHSPRLKDILAPQENVNILLMDYDVVFVEKFCRLLYQGYTVMTGLEAEEAKKLASYLNFENPKVSSSTQELLLGSKRLKIERTRSKPTGTSSGHDVKARDKAQVGSGSVDSNRNKKRRSRRARNAQSSLSGTTSGVLQERNSNKQRSRNGLCSSSDESGSKFLPSKRRKTGRYEQECNEEFAPEDISSVSTNETGESGSKSDLSSNSDSDSDIVLTRRNLRTRRLPSDSEGVGRRLRGRRRSGAPNKPGTTSARYAFGSCHDDDARCYFCACDFNEQELANHLSDPQVPCGNQLIGQFSFKTRLCVGCSKTFSDLTHWGYIKHLHSCSSLQSSISRKREKSIENVNVNKDCSSGPRQQPERKPTHMEAEKVIAQIEDGGSISEGSISTDVEKFDVTEIGINAHYLPLKTALTLREEGRKKESQRIQELKARQPKPAMAPKAPSDSSTVRTEYVMKRRPGGPGPASKTGRSSLKVTFVRRPALEAGKAATQVASGSATLEKEQRVQRGSDQSTQPLHPEKPSALGATSSAPTIAKLGKIKELFRCSICYEVFNDVHNATECRWGKGMQLCWICHAIFLVGEKCTHFEQFDYCNTRFRLHCSEAEHSFIFEGKTVVSCPHCGELVPIEAIHDHIESIHVRDYEIDREVKKANRAKARAGGNALVVEESEVPAAEEPTRTTAQPIHAPELPAVRISVPLPPNTSNASQEIRSSTPSSHNPVIPDQQKVGTNTTTSAASTSSASLGLLKPSSSTSSDAAKRPVLKYSNSRLRRTIDLIVGRIREQNRNATPDRIHKALIEFLEEQQRLKAQDPRPGISENVREYEPIQLQRITTLLEEMKKEGLLKYSEAKKAYKRTRRAETPQHWTEKKFRKIVRHALRDLSALDSSTRGFNLETIEDHVTHAFVIEKPPPGSNESLRQMLGKALRLEISNGNVEIVRGQSRDLYRLTEEIDPVVPDENVESANKISAPAATAVISKQNQTHREPAPTQESAPVVQQKQRSIQNLSPVLEPQPNSKPQKDRIVPSKAPPPPEIVHPMKKAPLPTVPTRPSNPPAATVTKPTTTILNPVATVIAKTKAPDISTLPQVIPKAPPIATPMPEANPSLESVSKPSSSSIPGSSANVSFVKPAAVATRVNNEVRKSVQAEIACPPTQTQTKPIITDATKGREKAPVKTLLEKAKEERRQNVAKRMLKAMTKPVMHPPSQAAATVVTPTIPTTVPPIGTQSAGTVEPEPQPSCSAVIWIENDPMAASSRPVPSPPDSSIIVGETSSYCADCGMTYENAEAASFHICI